MKKKYNKTYFKSLDINTLNTELPLNLRELETIINEVSKKYPILTKIQISMISKKIMEEIREQLLAGNGINIREFLFDMKLFTFCKLRKNKITFNTKIQVSTPLKIKNSKC